MSFLHISMNWIYISLLAMLFTGLTPVFAKVALKRMSALMGTAILSVPMAVILWNMVRGQQALTTLRSLPLQTWLLLLLVSLADGLGVFFYLFLIQKAEVSKVQPLRLLEVLLYPLAAALVIKEPIGQTDLLFLIIGLLGILLLIICRKRGKSEGAWFLWGLLSVALFLVNRLLIRVFLSALNLYLILAVEVTSLAVVSWIIILLTHRSHEFWRTTIYHGLFMLLAGLSAGFAILCLWQALTQGDTVIVNTLQGIAPAVTILLSAAALRERLSAGAAVGLILLTASLMLSSAF